MWLETYQQKVTGTSLPRWLPHPLTSPLFPDLTLLISFHHTDYNICHLSLSLSLGVSLSQGLWLRTTEMLSLKAFCQPNPQFLLSSFTSFNYILTSIFFPTHRRLLRLSPKTNILFLFSISNSWLLLQFLAPVLLTPAIFFTSFVQFFFSRFFSHQKINIKLPSISIFNAHFVISFILKLLCFLLGSQPLPPFLHTPLPVHYWSPTSHPFLPSSPPCLLPSFVASISSLTPYFFPLGLDPPALISPSWCCCPPKASGVSLSTCSDM